MSENESKQLLKRCLESTVAHCDDPRSDLGTLLAQVRQSCALVESQRPTPRWAVLAVAEILEEVEVMV